MFSTKTTDWKIRLGTIVTAMTLALASATAQVGSKEIRSPDTDLNYSGIVAVDDSTYVLVGEQVFENEKATIAVTHDKGQTWDVQRGLATGRLRAGYFVDSQRGWVVGEAGAVLATKDGGKSWDVQTSKSFADLYAVYFLDAERGWAVGENSTVTMTTNGGRTWKLLQGGQKPSEVGEGAVMYMGVHFIDEKTGYVVGAGEQGVILKTTDGGSTWEPVFTAEDNFEDIAFADATRGWAVGKFGLLVATTDGGATWEPQDSGTEENLKDVAVADANTVWISGEYGTIGYTTDGGATWTLLEVPVEIFGKTKTLTQTVPGIAARGKSAWAVTDFGRVIYFALQ